MNTHMTTASIVAAVAEAHGRLAALGGQQIQGGRKEVGLRHIHFHTPEGKKALDCKSNDLNRLAEIAFALYHMHRQELVALIGVPLSASLADVNNWLSDRRKKRTIRVFPPKVASKAA